MILYEKRSNNMTLLVPYIPLAPKIPIESGSNSNLEPPPPVRTSDRYDLGPGPFGPIHLNIYNFLTENDMLGK